MKNPYKIYLDNFFETINDLKHTTNRINKVLLKDVERYTKKEANFLSGTALIIGDWTGPTDNGWKKTNILLVCKIFLNSKKYDNNIKNKINELKIKFKE